MGRLLEHVVAHEIGHTLGFQHNMKASSLYPAEKVRDREWVKRMGHTPTLMDYSRFNYVAQPEDHIDPADLIPRIGPYDRWATMWGYKPIPGARTPDEEKKTLDEWARQQDQTPWLRFSTADAAGSDPGDLTEAVGDADAVRSTAMGLKNLERVANMLLTATTKRGEPYDDLEEMYGRLIGQWVLELNHVAAIVGGLQSQEKVFGQDGPRFTPVSRERQQQAVQFLNAHAFTTPAFVIKPEILRRIEPAGVLGRIRTAQQRVLATLLAAPRIARLVEQEALDSAAAYRPTRVPRRRAPRHLARAGGRIGADRSLPPQPSARVSRADERQDQRAAGGHRRRTAAGAGRAPIAAAVGARRPGQDGRSRDPVLPGRRPRPDHEDPGSEVRAAGAGAGRAGSGVRGARRGDLLARLHHSWGDTEQWCDDRVERDRYRMRREGRGHRGKRHRGAAECRPIDVGPRFNFGLRRAQELDRD